MVVFHKIANSNSKTRPQQKKNKKKIFKIEKKNLNIQNKKYLKLSATS